MKSYGTYEIDCSGGYAPKLENCEKDNLILKLKGYIQELEMNIKDNEILKQKYRQLQNDYATLSEAKIQTEQELNESIECCNKTIKEINSKNEDLIYTMSSSRRDDDSQIIKI